ncbi:MAG: right-handed parallel beta-helix repeat-containing protein, partial [Litorilinea sp.]
LATTWLSGPTVAADTATAYTANAATNSEPHAPQASRAVFTVNSAADPGDAECTPAACTLRAAILAANAAGEASTIEFNLPGDGPHTIAVQTALPTLVAQITIDGTTQPGYTDAPVIELDGSATTSSEHGLNIGEGADFSQITGLAINRFGGSGIVGTNMQLVTIHSNYIGVGLDGATALGNGYHGVVLINASNNTLHSNRIGGNQRNGIYIFGAEARDNVIWGNFIGTNPDNQNLGNGDDGIAAVSSGPQIIGGTYLDGNAPDGSPLCCRGNTIAYNAGNGLAIYTGFGASYEKGILSNRIYANGGLGIDLENDGVNANDPNDSDGENMANRLQNYPVLTDAYVENGITITGTLTTTAETDFRLEFFANTECDDSGHGEGERYLGYLRGASDAAGVLSFGAVITTTVDAVQPNDFITATATDLFGNTSEFSACIQATGEAATQPSTYLPTLSKGSASP